MEPLHDRYGRYPAPQAKIVAQTPRRRAAGEEIFGPYASKYMNFGGSLPKFWPAVWADTEILG